MSIGRRRQQTAADERAATNEQPLTTNDYLMFSTLSAIVPMACVTAAAIAAMTAEAFRAPGERMPIAPLGAIGLAGAGVAAVLLWNRNATSFGLVTADNFGLFVTGVLVIVGFLSLALSGPTVEREKLPRGLPAVQEKVTPEQPLGGPADERSIDVEYRELQGLDPVLLRISSF